EDAADALREVYRIYGTYRMVIDSAPDFTLCKSLQTTFGEYVNPCVYVKDNPKKPRYFEVQEDGMVFAARTKGLDAFVKVVNEGRATFAKCDELREVVEHY